MSSQTVPLAADLLRSVSSNPALSEDTLQCLQCLAAEIRNNEVGKSVLLQSGAINSILMELEAGYRNKSR